MNMSVGIFILLLIVATAFSVIKKKLTIPAIVVANLLAIIIFIATGLNGVALLGTFFILGIAATAWNRNITGFSIYREDEQRDVLQVLANGGMACIIAILSYLFPDYEPIFLLMIACTFSSAAADTVSSELGTIYGKRFYNIITMQKDLKGENGVISMEGTVSGIAASVIVAVIYLVMVETDATHFFIIVAAGTIGNLSDSVLGASLERKNIIGNNAVNFLNTFIAAAAGGAISY
jgi:uncharacterized protein (TIGR00297 family)